MSAFISGRERAGMIERTASCSCRSLSIRASGEPKKISACHCAACQKRTGSAFGVAVFYDCERTTTAGVAQTYVRRGDSGQNVEFHFCPTCGSTVFWYPAIRPGWVAIAIGCLDDKSLRPTQAAYEHDRLGWASISLPESQGDAIPRIPK
jgi:hypothetical protein